MRTLNPEVSKILFDGTREQRRYALEIAPEYFPVYYFPEFFHYQMASFHFDMWNDYKAMMRGEVSDVMDIIFRESAKTSVTKLQLCHAICYKKRKYINWDSYDGANAEQALFDVTVWLQTNQRLIADFGELYNAPKGDTKTKKRISDFITTNGVRVEAHTTQESIRGRIFNDQRPDWIIFDDIETNVTKESPAITARIISHVDEANTGMAPNGVRTYLCNFITDVGVVQHLKTKLEREPTARIRNVPVEINGQLTWPAKYAFTDKEAAERTTDPEHPIVSLETKKRTTDNYSAEFLNDPTNAEDAFFTRHKVDRALELASDPIEINAGLYLFERFKRSHRYAIGGDPAEGAGRDACASTIIDFSAGEVVGTFYDNHMDQAEFGDELNRQGDLFGTPLIAPERNVGAATVLRLIQTYPTDRIFVERDDSKIKNKRGNKYGWWTGGHNKNELLTQFKAAFENNQLKIYCRRLLSEMRVFTRAHLRETPGTATNHFDLLMSAAIAWAMRDHAPMPLDDEVEEEFAILQAREDIKKSSTY